MNIQLGDEAVKKLYEVILKLDSVEDCKALFEDLCTYKEIEQMAQRVEAAALLKQGMTYNKGIEQTEISSATLSRVSRALQFGEGYKKFV